MDPNGDVTQAFLDALNAIREASEALGIAVDLTESQYIAMHDGRRVSGLDYEPADEFIVDRVGQQA